MGTASPWQKTTSLGLGLAPSRPFPGAAGSSGPPPMSHRWWRMYAVQQDGSDGYLNLKVIQLRATPGGVNQCLGSGGTAYQSSEYSGIYGADNAFFELSGFWHSAFSGSVVGAWWAAFDFGAGNEKAVTEIAMQGTNVAGRQPRFFAVQYSDDSTNGADGAWTTAWYVDNATGWDTTTLRVFTQTVVNLVTSSWWKIKVTAEGGYSDGYTEIARAYLFNAVDQNDWSTATVTDTSHYSIRVAANLVHVSDCSDTNDTWTTDQPAGLPQSAVFHATSDLSATDLMMYSFAETVRYPSAFDVYTSPDGTTWTLVKSFTGIPEPISLRAQYYSLA